MNNANTALADEQPVDGFLALKPVVERHANIVFRNLSAVDREEAVAEAVAAAFRSFLSLVRRHKSAFEFPSMIAIRAVQHVRNGRRVGSRMNGRDVSSEVARQRRGVLDPEPFP